MLPVCESGLANSDQTVGLMSKKPKAKAPAATAIPMGPKKIGKGQKLPATDHVARHVPWQRLRRDEDDNVLGVLPEAFRLRSGELGMSVNWLEHYPGDHQARLAAVIGSLRVNLNIRPKSAFAIANVGTLENCCKQSGSSVRIVYAPTKEIPCHALVRDMNHDDLGLLDLLADDVFTEFVQNKDIP